jgi:phosphoribosylformimino-5-aminoimidazole carboxamide ribotide isomerase
VADHLRLLPVLDLRGGVVVRGVGGRRHEYRPVISRLTPSSRPVDVAGAFRAHLGLSELYLADLDALAGAEPDWPTFAALHAAGFRLWIDAGVRQFGDVERLLDAGVTTAVIGLETVAGPEVLRAAAVRWPGRVVFSLDLRAGRPLAAADWAGPDAWSVATQAVCVGVRRLLVLDLDRVGLGQGTGQEELCARLTATFAGVEVSAGGGVSGPDDLARLRACGVAVVLAASALHDGRLGPADVTPW